MKVDWTFITEDGHFANGLGSRREYWVLYKYKDGAIVIGHEGTDKFGDFSDNDYQKEDPNWPRKVIAFAELEYPEVPEIPA